MRLLIFDDDKDMIVSSFPTWDQSIPLVGDIIQYYETPENVGLPEGAEPMQLGGIVKWRRFDISNFGLIRTVTIGVVRK